jgi:hypothetical protein
MLGVTPDLVVAEGVFDIQSGKAFRHYVNIDLLTLNSKSFKGTVTYQEAN